jgi:hypothetical protein
MARIKSYCCFTFEDCTPCDWQTHCKNGRETQCNPDETRPDDCKNGAVNASEKPNWSTCLNCNRCPDTVLPMRALVAPLVKSFRQDTLGPQLALFEDLKG